MDDDFPAMKQDPLIRLQKQDLTPLSVSELAQRITSLKAEIARSQAHLAKAGAVKSDAEALFKKG